MANQPLHSAIVHWPLALIISAHGFDALQLGLPFIPKDIVNYLPTTTELSIISYYILSLGLLTGLAAVATGIYQASRLVARLGGVYDADKKAIKPKVKTLVAHAALNDIVLLSSAAYWRTRREAGGAASVPDATMLAVGVALGSIQLFAAGLGRSLVYSAGAGKAKKSQ
ncbi:hypothetical protein N7509_003114 [Penicillium cosmopolitanum]|uniref:DUF2231 domain-containing protein n=1 Tax=Penicillium cosmopolitanum TaxID=1131564 RepID=A0A9X0BB51_9EURO|nr:uncharacterized protein N7509_003114 [Penicillium cosmopolitanum]KAJ5403243.1 hypothetical protein N7509_003114 [Penicillium cosmopolitanum]